MVNIITFESSEPFHQLYSSSGIEIQIFRFERPHLRIWIPVDHKIGKYFSESLAALPE